MKKLILLTLAAALFACCSPSGTRVVERPESGLRNTQTIEIDKVILSDTATVLYMDAYFRPNWWIKIASDTYLKAKGEKYLITRAEGIEIDAEHYMPESGEYSFILYFPPLPKGIKSFDFIEGDCDDCFKIWDIDLTGNYKPAYGIPARLRTPVNGDSAPLTEPELEIAVSKVTASVYGRKEGFSPDVELSVDVLPKGEPVNIRPSSVEGDVYTFEFPVYGTSNAVLTVGFYELPFIIAPGEDIEIHYDLLATAIGSSRYSTMERPVYAAFTGKYAAVNNERNLPGKGFDMSLYDLIGEPGLWKFDQAQYDAKIKEVHDTKVAEIDELGVSDNLKKVYMQDIKSLDIFHLLAEDMIRMNSRYSETGDFEQSEFVPVSQAKLDALKALEPDDPYWLLSRRFMSVLNSFMNLTDQQTLYVTGSETGFLNYYRNAAPIYMSARWGGQDIPQEAMEKFRAGNPFFVDSYDTMLEYERVEKEKALAEGGFVIKDTPDVPADKILDAIVAEYSGKVVFVDFWATWCGPCLQGMKMMKPLKPEMEEHGVVTVYISNESSPEAKWISMLPDIGGIHYYLDSEPWRTLCDKYGIEGIPSYMIFDEQGNKVFQQIGFPGAGKLKEELEKVW